MQSAGRPLPSSSSASPEALRTYLHHPCPTVPGAKLVAVTTPAPQFRPAYGTLGSVHFLQRVGLRPSEVTAWEAALALCPPMKAIFGASQLPADTEHRTHPEELP